MYSIMHLLTEEEGKLAVAAARAYIEAAVTHGEADIPALPEIFSDTAAKFSCLG